MHALDNTDVLVVEIVPVLRYMAARRAVFIGAGTVTDKIQRDGFVAVAGTLGPGGDAVSPRTVEEAVLDGFNTARLL